MSYRCFAQFYDILTQNIPYRARGEYFHALFQRYGLPGNIVLDLACGTGSLTEALASLGYDMIGVDGSEEMLAEAMNKKYDAQSNTLYLCQDMESLDLYGTVDGCVCALDSLNHITDYGALSRAVARVSLFLAPGGVFLFEVNTVYKHEQILSDRAYVYDLDDVCCVWQNSVCHEKIIDITLDFFARRDDGLYERESEAFSERAYTHGEICALLQKNGLTLLDCFGDDSFAPPKDDAQRVIYAARSAKKKG